MGKKTRIKDGDTKRRYNEVGMTGDMTWCSRKDVVSETGPGREGNFRRRDIGAVNDGAK